MSDIVCVTSSALCRGDFLERLKHLADSPLYAVILREKQLDEGQYASLASRALDIFDGSEVRLILHNYPYVAMSVGAKRLHLPLKKLLSMPRAQLSGFEMLGASCHSPADIRAAEEAGCTYVTLGNIFETSCKVGLAGKGIEFLRECCSLTKLPVWAIGGITPQNVADVRNAGAACVCSMGAFMQSEDLGELIKSLG